MRKTVILAPADERSPLTSLCPASRIARYTARMNTGPTHMRTLSQTKLRPRKCRNEDCRQWFRPSSTLDRACSPACEQAIRDAKVEKDTARAMAHVNRQRREREKAERAEHRARKARLKSVGALASEAANAVQVWVRIRDEGRPCISCGAAYPTEAGHLIHAGTKYRASPLRFDERNINLQCHRCNRHESGAEHGYRLGLVARYGQARLDEIDALKRAVDRGEVPPLGKDELIALAREYRRRARAAKANRE